MAYRVRAAGLTDVGLRRGHNEDCILVVEDLGLFAVADGMGGHAAGEVASNTAINEMMDYVQAKREDTDFQGEYNPPPSLKAPGKMLHDCIKKANEQLCSMANENAAYGGMGTTIAAILFDGDDLHVAHVGDSRVYRFEGGRLEPLTQDHSWVNEQLRKNSITEEEARTHRWRNVITRALGNRLDVEVDVATVELREENFFLLCSDGITSMIEDVEVEEYLDEADLDDLDEVADGLVQMANEAGGHDNISVVVVRIDQDSAMDEDSITGEDDGAAALILDDDEEIPENAPQVSLGEETEQDVTPNMAEATGEETADLPGEETADLDAAETNRGES